MSGRIRSVKPEWLDDEKIAMASADARVMSIALLLLADDYGNGRANSVMLQSRVFPGTVGEQAESSITELVAIGYVSIYSVDGQLYFSIRNWSKHQRVEKKGRPKVPPPPVGVGEESGNAPGKVVERSGKDSYNNAESLNSGNVPGTVGDSSATPPARANPDPDPIPDPTPIPIPDPERLLTAEQRQQFEVQMVPGWAVDAMLRELHLKQAGGSKRMPIDQWHSYAAVVLTNRWNDNAKRPKNPAAEISDVERKRIIARREEAQRQEIIAHRAKIEAELAAKGAA